MPRSKLLKDSLLEDLLYLLPLSAFFLFFRLGNGSLASWDEALYAAVAKEVFESGRWLHFTFGGSLWFDKPPLCIWATVLFYKLFGVGEFAARLFSALTGFGTVALTYFLGRRMFNRWTGFLGALVLLSSSHFLHFARFGMMDVPLTFFLSLAFYFFWLGREKDVYLIGSGVAIGLAMLTKSFAALLFFPIVWIYCLWCQELEILKRPSYWIGVGLAAALVLPWNLYEFFRHREAFMNDALVKHLLTRVFTVLEGHEGNWYFYIRTLVNKYHPWVIVGIVSAPYFLYRAIRDGFQEYVLLTVWMFFIFFVITWTQTKLQWYIFPVYPALSLSVGSVLGSVFKDNQKNFIRLTFLIIMVLHVPYSHIFNHDYSRDIKGLTQAVLKEVPAGESVTLYNYHESPAVMFYWGRRTLYLDDPQSFLAQAKSETPFYGVIHKRDLDPLREKLLKLGFSVKASFENLELVTKT
jgi:4-amino-4-deoxy-L-arabinose transferase-like glycosyltransferase